jgi:Ser/Thr protein kinase RdoA (MazF antagonist)
VPSPAGPGSSAVPAPGGVPGQGPAASADEALVPSPHGRHALPAADEPGPLLASGMCADVYALDDERVLRRYRNGADATGEVALMQHVAEHGFPVPRVDSVEGSDIVMERLHGPTLLQALGADEVSLHEGGAILADLHRRLHEVPAPEGAEGEVVVHLDLHPGNIVLSEAHGPSLVDWANARTGTAALDVALTALIIAEVAVDAGGAYSQAARALLAAFLAESEVDPSPALDEGARVRAQDPALVEGEADLVPAAVALIRDLIEVARPE